MAGDARDVGVVARTSAAGLSVAAAVAGGSVGIAIRRA